MTISPDEIRYWLLPVADRLVLAQDILDSVLAETSADSLTPEQIADLDRVCDAIDSGAMATRPWDEVRRRVFGPPEPPGSPDAGA